LVLGPDFNHRDVTYHHGIPKMMPFDMKVLGASGDALASGQCRGTIIVFEDGAADGGLQGFPIINDGQ
jgi:hypothetical protein